MLVLLFFHINYIITGKQIIKIELKIYNNIEELYLN